MLVYRRLRQNLPGITRVYPFRGGEWHCESEPYFSRSASVQVISQQRLLQSGTKDD